MADLRKITTRNERKYAKIQKWVTDCIAEGRTQEVLDNMTPRQKNFVEEYLVDYNATAALKRAGYLVADSNAKKYASELMDHPAIRCAINVASENKASKSAIKPDYVIKKIMRTIESAEQSGAHNAVLKGCELLARHLGMFIERQEISGPNGDPIKYEQVKEAADSFTSAIASLIEREGPGEGIIVTNTGSEGSA